MNEQEKIADEIYKIMQKLGPTEEDKDYIAYIMFSVVGAGLLKMLGEEKFDELVSELKSRREVPDDRNCH